MSELNNKTRIGPRLAYICEKCDPPRARVFIRGGKKLKTVPRCSKHGPMTIQVNANYFGNPTPKPK